MLLSKYEDNALQIKEKSTERTAPFFVLEVTAHSAADILGIHPNSATERVVTWSTKNGAVLSVLFSLICSALSSYFEGDISANLVQPLVK